MTNYDDLVSQTEAAEILGVDASTVSRWSDERQEPGRRRLTIVRRFGYTKAFLRSDVEALRDQLRAEREEAKSA